MLEWSVFFSVGSDGTALVLIKFIQSEPLLLTVLSLTFHYIMLTLLILRLHLIPSEESLCGRA